MPISPHSRHSRHDFNIPANTSGRGNEFSAGPGVRVYWDLQPPNRWPEHVHALTQVVIASDPILASMTWQKFSGIQSVSCQTPHIWIVPPQTIHSAEWKGTSAMVVLYVEKSFLLEECGGEPAEAAVLDLEAIGHSDILIKHLCMRFHELCHGKRSYCEIFITASATILAREILKTYMDPQGPRALIDERLKRALDHIERHLKEALTVENLAAVAHLTRHHFGRLFKKYVGRSPMDFVWRRRTYHALDLLQSGKWKVADVAAECGFSDQSHLDWRFQQEFKCSPGTFIPRPNPHTPHAGPNQRSAHQL